MQLKWTMLAVGLVLVLAHLIALVKPKSVQESLRKFPRNYEAGVLMAIVAAAWFFLMVKTMDLGEFVTWKSTVLFVTPLAAGLSILYMRDFLAVRAFGMLVLMLAEPLLESAWMHYEALTLLMKLVVYVWISFAMFWVGMPYTLRNQIAWVSANENRWRVASLLGLIVGAMICVGGVLASTNPRPTGQASAAIAR